MTRGRRPQWSAVCALAAVVAPFRSVRTFVIDLSEPVPTTVVPVGRFGHVADVRTNVTGNSSTIAPAAAVLAANASTETTSAPIVKVSRFTCFPLSGPPWMVGKRPGRGDSASATSEVACGAVGRGPV